MQGAPGEWRAHRSTLFFRFLMVFGLMALFVLGGMAALAFLITRLAGGSGPTAVLVWAGGLVLTLALPVLGIMLGIRAFRSIAVPLADVMGAADAIAKGDLTTRVPEGRRSAFNTLAVSFNRMVEELQRTDQLRRNLTADVAHELRTPLHVIHGNLEGLLDGVYETTPEHVGATLEETRLLSRLVEDLGTLALAESGQLTMSMATLDVNDLLAESALAYAAQAQSAGIQLLAEPADDVSPLTVNADAGRLQQVLGNLIANALRHTPEEGTITLRAARDQDAIHLEVEDTGEGISEEDLPFVFDRFWRGDRARTHKATVGGGLGLAIARQLVRDHGGAIDVRSSVGKGTIFTITLPSER